MKITTRLSRTRLRPQFLSLALLVPVLGLYFFRPQAVTPEVVADPVVAVTAEPVTPRVDCAALKCIALTFDDGPDANITPQILDILKKHNAHATFFVQGVRIGGKEAILRRAFAEGHEIGNHSWNHPYFTRIPLDQVQSEIESTQNAVIKAGVPAPRLFRPPYGDMNEAVLAHIPLTVVRWNIDPEDWHPKRQTHLLEHMAAHARPGGVAVMHDTEPATLERLDGLLTQLEAQQYRAVTVSDALGIQAGQPGVYFSRYRVGL
ncbi:MAG: polysaccharide deacetylase family protein [Candidatus Saccharimonadales bacterium]